MKLLLILTSLLISGSLWADVDDGYDYLFKNQPPTHIKYLHCKTDEIEYELEKDIQTEAFYRLNELEETYLKLSYYKACAILGEDCKKSKNPSDMFDEYMGYKPIKLDKPTWVGDSMLGRQRDYYKTDEHLVLAQGSIRINRKTLEFGRDKKILGLFNSTVTYKCSLEQESVIVKKFTEYEKMKSDLREVKMKGSKI